MNEKSLEVLQKKARRVYFWAIFFSAAVFLAIVSPLFFLLLTTPSGMAYLKESPAELAEILEKIIQDGIPRLK